MAIISCHVLTLNYDKLCANIPGLMHTWWLQINQRTNFSYEQYAHQMKVMHSWKYQQHIQLWHETHLYVTTTCTVVMCPLCAQNVEFVRTGYGKNAVKVLVIRRQGSHHDIIELKADVQLTLKSRKDYLNGDNSDIIPTDTIKNTVHALAKLKGVR